MSVLQFHFCPIFIIVDTVLYDVCCFVCLLFSFRGEMGSIFAMSKCVVLQVWGDLGWRVRETNNKRTADMTTRRGWMLNITTHMMHFIFLTFEYFHGLFIWPFYHSKKERIYHANGNKSNLFILSNSSNSNVFHSKFPPNYAETEKKHFFLIKNFLTTL